ncbi:hypothetical protein AQUCO_00300445v1 [Aquilegia coerulea]|uniref:Uncharacterized protein n=1 Tax=Aquilegia coerulea TaxID=218851 RepID=A0A2G5EYY3_AQUCA|nr:hypothetical protein AQUCO_00300445v1 [Aquilegia coerulea]
MKISGKYRKARIIGFELFVWRFSSNWTLNMCGTIVSHNLNAMQCKIFCSDTAATKSIHNSKVQSAYSKVSIQVLYWPNFNIHELFGSTNKFSWCRK